MNRTEAYPYRTSILYRIAAAKLSTGICFIKQYPMESPPFLLIYSVFFSLLVYIVKEMIKKQIEKKNKKLINYNWIIKITLISFMISIIFSSFSELIIPNVNIFIAILLLIIFIRKMSI